MISLRETVTVNTDSFFAEPHDGQVEYLYNDGDIWYSKIY